MTATVLCLGPAGAGPSFFRDWRADGVDLEILPVPIPGRERRFGEPAHRDVAGLVGVLAPEMAAVTRETDHVVVLGHCSGAIIAYELCRAMAAGTAVADGGPALSLVASGSTRPGVPYGSRIADAPDEEFIVGVERLAGYSYPALVRPEMREVLLPPMRADVAIQEGYRHDDRAAPLEVPVLSVRGTDDEIVDEAQARRWCEITTGPFRSAELPGRHMYLLDRWPQLLSLVSDAVAHWAHV